MGNLIFYSNGNNSENTLKVMKDDALLGDITKINFKGSGVNVSVDENKQADVEVKEVGGNVGGVTSGGKLQVIKSNVSADTENPLITLDFPKNTKYNSAGLLTPWVFQRGTEVNEFIRQYDNTKENSFIHNENIEIDSTGIGVKTLYSEDMMEDGGVFTYTFPDSFEEMTLFGGVA